MARHERRVSCAAARRQGQACKGDSYEPPCAAAHRYAGRHAACPRAVRMSPLHKDEAMYVRWKHPCTGPEHSEGGSSWRCARSSDQSLCAALPWIPHGRSSQVCRCCACARWAWFSHSKEGIHVCAVCAVCALTVRCAAPGRRLVRELPGPARDGLWPRGGWRRADAAPGQPGRRNRGLPVRAVGD